jgi:NDP-sugar pyrophosphorylase family protein
MVRLSEYIRLFPFLPGSSGSELPWEITGKLPEIITRLILQLDDQYRINNEIAVHRTAVIEDNAVIKAPAIIGGNCFIGSNAYLRGGVLLDRGVTVGPGCEIKCSIIGAESHLAHFNFIGDSIIGSGVNFEAGSVIANHYNERTDKKIQVIQDSRIMDTGVEKFGALVGDNCRIGANAVLSPGTLLKPGYIVKRLELIAQT